MPQGSGPAASGGLLVRIATGIVLVALALFAVWQGGLVFTALAAAAGLLMFAEWAVMHRLSRGVRLAGLVVIAAVVLMLTLGLVVPGEALMTLAAAAPILGMFAARFGALNGNDDGNGKFLQDRSAGFLTAWGLLYCGLPVLALVWLRSLPLGLEVVVFLMLCVWSADILAYFAGRILGGPKLAPAISPKKTWAGAIGGVIGAMIIAGGLAAVWLKLIGGRDAALFIALAGVFAVLSVLGDLLESWLKRRAGVKDSGTLLPGHGGVLDRLDGLVPVALAGAMFFMVTGWAG
jgi:phosphatidate cytidylyltransferase